MSITFYPEPPAGQPVPQVKRYCKDLYPGLDEAEFAEDPYVQRDAQGYYELRNAWPEVNFSNTNARAVLVLLGLPDEDFGCIEAATISAVRQRLLIALNVDSVTVAVERKPGESRGARGARFIEGEAYAESFKRRLDQISEVLAFAQREGVSVIWS